MCTAGRKVESRAVFCLGRILHNPTITVSHCQTFNVNASQSKHIYHQWILNIWVINWSSRVGVQKETDNMILPCKYAGKEKEIEVQCHRANKEQCQNYTYLVTILSMQCYCQVSLSGTNDLFVLVLWCLWRSLSLMSCWLKEQTGRSLFLLSPAISRGSDWWVKDNKLSCLYFGAKILGILDCPSDSLASLSDMAKGTRNPCIECLNSLNNF